ncbi:hypothetical protein EYF80_011272 [Liparis tanakae]|uniref:Uncharacterized protein n=1 Tax=Liparis tanakae TaxID=230148 RepID=A0A4Z2IKG5_9TELE|nr:hypothetical protein EYF80_011272 [Liparis tanakae]
MNAAFQRVPLRLSPKRQCVIQLDGRSERRPAVRVPAVGRPPGGRGIREEERKRTEEEKDDGVMEGGEEE